MDQPLNDGYICEKHSVGYKAKCPTCAFEKTQFREGQPVKHIKRKLHEARFAGYTKSGRIKVNHNAFYPLGVSWVTDTFKPENIVTD